MQERDLAQASAEILGIVQEKEERMTAYYDLLTRAEVKDKEPLGIDEEVEALKTSARELKRAYRKTAAMADELDARLKDARARKHRWYRKPIPTNAEIDMVERSTMHFTQGANLYKLFWLFFVGSIIGVVVEELACLVYLGHFENRAGLVYGPFAPIYGAGAVALTLALYPYRNRGYSVCFLGSMAVGSAVEYACSWIQEILFGSRSWNYSGYPLNLDGRISLLHALIWGCLGVVWIKNLYPGLSGFFLMVPSNAGRIVTWVLAAFMTFNCLVTSLAVTRWSRRVAGKAQDWYLGEVLDARFPDERMSAIFTNMAFLDEK